MIARWLEQRRDGVEQSAEEIASFVGAATRRELSDAQIGAWLAFVMVRGMSARETVALTIAMRDSGRTLAWDGIAGPRWDKHSTGGVGDKVSLVLAPLWAALGVRVPMISGRSLGITGGTLDKLESIPGFRTDLAPEALRQVLGDVGCFIVGQSADLAPADRLLYALRDETQTVPSVPLITASILSKKLAEGIERLVLDVKFGSGAFMKDRVQAEALAASLQEVGRGAGLETEALLTPMNEPLGRAIGNALEVEEAEEALRGGGPEDLVELVVRLSGGGERARAALRDGSAARCWERMVSAQGGDLEAPRHGAQELRHEELLAERDGRITRCDAGEIGRAVFALGAGRSRAGAPVHHGVGIRLARKCGEEVRRGEPLAALYHADRGRDEAIARVRAAYVVSHD